MGFSNDEEVTGGIWITNILMILAGSVVRTWKLDHTIFIFLYYWGTY
ncbi:hypothetical protein LOK49_LG12G02021 [Camellia lanceoleosa]|uniref:Uncharacterized protein n=1 Tax=Camellia lanceoleosa TaxID=1840588 RepID=A0ACC0FWU4_9ERIC|nr:hypothetical protein LOK49_LG12G02021 [Camellia lanceoleosa]